jgi:hypothetical protein
MFKKLWDADISMTSASHPSYASRAGGSQGLPCGGRPLACHRSRRSQQAHAGGRPAWTRGSCPLGTSPPHADRAGVRERSRGHRPRGQVVRAERCAWGWFTDPHWFAPEPPVFPVFCVVSATQSPIRVRFRPLKTGFRQVLSSTASSVVQSTVHDRPPPWEGRFDPKKEGEVL